MTYPQIIQSVIKNGPCGSHFGFKNFQLEDYARGALHDGLVLGHDTGGGKSLALFTWPALKVGFVSIGKSSSSSSPDFGPRALTRSAPSCSSSPATGTTRPSPRMPP